MGGKRRLVVSLVAGLVLATGGYLEATNVAAGLDAYRSPLTAGTPAPGPPRPADRLSRTVVLVIVDGLRVDTSSSPSDMPRLDALRLAGASATMRSHTPSYSNPGWTVLLTGAWPDVNGGAAMNPPEGALPATVTGDDVVTAAHAAGLRTALVGNIWLSTLIPPASVDDHWYTDLLADDADSASTEQATNLLRGTSRPELLVVHLNNVDHTAHTEGAEGTAYAAAARLADGHLGALAAALNLGSASTAGRDTLVVVSDHGHIARGGHGGPEEPVITEPFVVAGAGVLPGRYPETTQTEVAPTVARLLGLRPLARAVGTGEAPLVRLPADPASYRTALQARDSVFNAAYASSVGDAPARLSGQRLRRWAAVLLLGLLLALAVRRLRPDRRVLVAVGAMLAVFHGVFWSTGRTYSLSWVTSSTNLIVTLVALTVVATVVGAVILLRPGPATADSSAAAERSGAVVHYVAVLGAVLGAPVLVHLAVDGPAPWSTLPEPHWAWWGVMGGVQLLALGVLAPVLVATALALDRRRTPRA